jgi:hypothetical protein
MGSVGDCFHNAMCESFFATLECELLDRTSFKTQAEARMAVFDFIEGLCEVHGAATNWKKTPRRHRWRREKQEKKNKKRSTQPVMRQSTEQLPSPTPSTEMG